MPSPTRLVATIVAAATASTACAKWAKEVDYGGLEQNARTLEFVHDVQLFRVKNGLTVALAPDDGTNLVTVDVRYQVGAAEDPAGRAGLAHLVEHLTFQARAAAGEPTLGDRLSQAALHHNAWTNWDETHYTATALDDQLDALLQIEAARMNLACDQLDDAIFARERDVVLQEEAQRGSPALAMALVADVFGKDHPYARPVGSREVATATKAEACAFVADHYAPERAILVISGRFDVEAITGRIAARFGPIRRAAAAPRVAIAPPVLDGKHVRHVADVDHPTAVVLLDAPAWGADDEAAHDLATTLLGIELRELDEEHAWIRGTTIGRLGGWRDAVTAIVIELEDEADLAKAAGVVETATQEVLAAQYSKRWLGSLIVQRLTSYAATYEQVMERASWLADFLQYTDHGGLMIPPMERLRTIEPAEVGQYLERLVARRVVASIVPRPEGGGARRDAEAVLSPSREHDLQPWRTPVDATEATAAARVDGAGRVKTPVGRFTLDNGLEVVLAPDRSTPLVDIRVVFPVGTAADPADRRGLASVAAYLLDHDLEGYLDQREYDKLEWAVNVGTLLEHDVDETSTTFSARGLSMFADWHVWRLAWLLKDGVYADEDLARLRRRVAEWDDGGAGEDDGPDASELLRRALFGADHPYAGDAPGADDYARLGRRDLERFRSSYYRARGATLIVTGDFDARVIEGVVRRLFGTWSGAAPAEAPAMPAVTPPRAPRWFGLRDDDRRQVGITIGFTSASHEERDRAARMILAEIVADQVRAVREGLGVSYGVEAGYFTGAGGGALTVSGDVDAAHAGHALRAMLDGIEAARGDAAAIAADFVRARRRVLARVLASSTETGRLASELAFIAEHDLPADYFTRLVDAVATTTVDDVVALAAGDLDATHQVVVLTGPGAAVDAALAEVGAEAEVEDLN